MRWLTAAALVLGVGFSTGAMAGIANTKHNLSTAGTGTNHVTAGTGADQICVFCHTPHGADTSAPVPLWNKKLPSTTYQTYDQLNTSTLDGKVLSVGSVSLACLSCHDGTQAMDNLINAPGAGGFNAGGARPAGWTWTGVGSDGLMPAGLTNIGADLRNDHPIGIQYCGGGLAGSGTTLSGSCNDSDFIAGTADGSGRIVKTATINTNQVFWVEVNATTGRQKDDIVLYTRDFVGSGGVGPSVECASCHDPHVESKGTDNIAFMRVTTAGSQICLSCHVK
ncbi:MAG: cytochrome c3 family protein [Rhodocyclaceae bacterium]|nr:cytochrome c3 family protein [Rhodocyclaceae bacterium]